MLPLLTSYQCNMAVSSMTLQFPVNPHPIISTSSRRTRHLPSSPFLIRLNLFLKKPPGDIRPSLTLESENIQQLIILTHSARCYNPLISFAFKK